jgi:hypothetical protein
MTLLVVGNHQVIDVRKIHWEILDGVMLVHCVKGGVFELKHSLEVHTRTYGIPLYITFALPPVKDVVPLELLIGFGRTKDEDVILYGQCDNSVHSELPG